MEDIKDNRNLVTVESIENFFKERNYTDKKGQAVVYKYQIKFLMDYPKLRPALSSWDNLKLLKLKFTTLILAGYDWDKTKKHLETLPDNNAKIKYLIQEISIYEQEVRYDLEQYGDPLLIQPSYDYNCKIELIKLEALNKIDLNAQIKQRKKPLLQNGATKTDKEKQPETFNELFYNVDLIESYIDVLRQVTPALIDKESNYIGHSKGAICVWMDEMEQQHIIKHLSDRKLYPDLICQKIKRFSIDESMFGKHHTRAETNYKTEFKTLLSKIKLSQNSQKGKLGK